MIITKLIGGLGNQLFQYAIAKKIALKYNTNVILDISSFEEYKLHKYSLENFNFKKKIAIIKDLKNCGLNSFSIFDKISYKLKRNSRNYVILKEKQFNYDERILKMVTENTYIDGYWQSEKYFYDIRGVLLNDLKIISPLKNRNLDTSNKISRSNSVSIHIRRADYVTNKKTLSIHGTCDINYYNKAIDIIKEKVKKPVFFIFSDDMPWVKENLKMDVKIIYVDHNNADTNFEDLRLMSMCKHNIIANSSFSWWGAWLNKNPDKIVIAPEKWFVTNERNYNDIIPATWYKI